MEAAHCLKMQVNIIWDATHEELPKHCTPTVTAAYCPSAVLKAEQANILAKQSPESTKRVSLPRI